MSSISAWSALASDDEAQIAGPWQRLAERVELDRKARRRTLAPGDHQLSELLHELRYMLAEAKGHGRCCSRTCACSAGRLARYACQNDSHAL
jgi:hypothetical protein